GTDGPPAPTSQQRHPGAIPSASTCRKVTGSKSADSAAIRSPASLTRLSRRYSLLLTASSDGSLPGTVRFGRALALIAAVGGAGAAALLDPSSQRLSRPEQPDGGVAAGDVGGR